MHIAGRMDRIDPGSPERTSGGSQALSRQRSGYQRSRESEAQAVSEGGREEKTRRVIRAALPPGAQGTRTPQLARGRFS